MSSRWNDISDYLIIGWIVLVGVSYLIYILKMPPEVRYLLVLGG